jgi:hypothetical protein
MKYSVLMAISLLVALPGGSGDLDVIRQNGQDCGLEGKPGGSDAQKDLNRHKNRYQMPGDADIDPEVSLAAMLAPGKDVKRFNQEKAATIRGLVIDVKPGGKESCNCEASAENEKDTHIELALAGAAPETQRVIVEVTPRLRILMNKKGVDWSTQTLQSDPQKKIKGKWVEVTGWMLFDTAHIKQAENTNPGNVTNWRATCWEIHPVTGITILEGPPDEAAGFQPASLTALHQLHASHIARSPNGKAAVESLHKEYLSKFKKSELEEAEEETRTRRTSP